MINKKAKGQYILTAVGFILFVAGLVLVILFSKSQGILRPLPFICLGIGAGLCGGGLGGIIKGRQLAKDPQLAKKIEIDTKDERNIAIANKAKAAAYNFTLFIFAALILFLSLVQAEAYITLVFVGAYVVAIALYLYFLIKYHKEM